MSQPDIRRYFRHGTLPQLRLFEATARLGSFARAARGTAHGAADGFGAD